MQSFHFAGSSRPFQRIIGEAKNKGLGSTQQTKNLRPGSKLETEIFRECGHTSNDGDKVDNDFISFRNLFNNFYARDTSKKIWTIMQTKRTSVEHLCTNPPYKDPMDKKKGIVDEEAVEIIKWIFDLCITRKGSMQIAKLLTTEYVLTAKETVWIMQ